MIIKAVGKRLKAKFGAKHVLSTPRADYLMGGPWQIELSWKRKATKLSKAHANDPNLIFDLAGCCW